MAKRTNSAQRMFVILKKASAQPDGAKIRDVWANAFNVKIQTSTKRDLEVVENLGLLHSQFQVTQSLIAQTDYSENSINSPSAALILRHDRC